MHHRPLSRRLLLKSGVALLGGALHPVRGAAAVRVQQPGRGHAIETATGAVPPDRLGVTLVHEHVLVDFIGAAEVSRARYDREDAFRRILPYLRRVQALGCETIVECTPAYLGRDPLLLRRLSEASGLQILTNTGYYGAAGDRFVPAHAHRESAEELAARWIAEWEDGIEGTGVRPAFMKIGVDEGSLSEMDAKLVRAAAITHRRTGLPIHSHTADGTAALGQLDTLENAGVPASAFVWVHAQSEKDGTYHVGAAKRGAWIEFDGVSESSIGAHLDLVRGMNAEGLLGRVLVSQDAGWYHVGEPEGGEFRAYDTLFTTFVPALERAGLRKADIRQLLVENPREALTRRPPLA